MDNVVRSAANFARSKLSMSNTDYAVPLDVEAAERTAQHLAAIIENSDDAILSKDLDGVIQSWNKGAERLFGYTAEEAIGRPVKLLIPADRQDEEPVILARLRRGEHVDHYETVRQRKDGTLIDISLSVSPIKDSTGKVVGASKIARDITDRKRAQEQQRLLLREMDHRIKNLFALATAVVTLTARSASSTDELAANVRERLAALTRAHALTLSTEAGLPAAHQPTTLHRLVDAIVAPYGNADESREPRVRVEGTDLPIAGTAVTSFALLLHEFATNAAKYGALSAPDGRVDIVCTEDGREFVVEWRESGGPAIDERPTEEGFGSLIGRRTVETQFRGTLTRDWRREGLAIRLALPLESCR